MHRYLVHIDLILKSPYMYYSCLKLIRVKSSDCCGWNDGRKPETGSDQIYSSSFSVLSSLRNGSLQHGQSGLFISQFTMHCL